MMHEPYDNQAEIDEVQRLVESVCPGLKISRYSLEAGHKNTVVSVRVTLEVKGNKKFIDNLVDIGFKKLRKRKRETMRYWNMYEGYSMLIDLEYTFPSARKEE